MRHHIRRHRQEKRFACASCPSAFTSKHNLSRHLVYGCNQAPRFKCPYCNMRSKEVSNVYRHVRNRHIGMPVHLIDLPTNCIRYARKGAVLT